MRKELKAQLAAVLADVVAELPYSEDDQKLLLLQRARLLMKIASSPNLTVSDLVVSANVRQQTIFEQMSDLLESGLIERTRSDGLNRYRTNLDKVLAHPDIALVLVGLLSLCSEAEPLGDEAA
jgi:DNA-binding MarR family transcriptional regulator